MNPIAAQRKKLGLTQEQLAEKVGVSRARLSQWERGHEPSFAHLRALARVLGVGVGVIVGEEKITTFDRHPERVKVIRERIGPDPLICEMLISPEDPVSSDHLWKPIGIESDITVHATKRDIGGILVDLVDGNAWVVLGVLGVLWERTQTETRR